MGNTEEHAEHYNEVWSEHQQGNIHPVLIDEAEDLGLPDSLECELFTDVQLAYLSDWWQEARRDVINKVLAFLVCQRKKRINRVKMRLVLLDKILNHPDLPWGETAAAYNVSQHALYNMKKEVERELAADNPRLTRLLFPRGHAKHERQARGESAE